MGITRKLTVQLAYKDALLKTLRNDYYALEAAYTKFKDEVAIVDKQNKELLQERDKGQLIILQSLKEAEKYLTELMNLRNRNWFERLFKKY